MHFWKIIGFDLSDSLAFKGCLRALNKVICQAKYINFNYQSDRVYTIIVIYTHKY
jgi:hypothetical protein